MSAADESTHLPPSIGGLIVFALGGWAANATFYSLLAAAVLLTYSLAEYVLPAAGMTTPQGEFKLDVLQYTGLFADAFVIAAVALGVAARGIGSSLSAGTLAGGATERWLPVIAVSFLAQSITQLTYAFSGLVAPPDPRALVYATAPIIWILWGVLGLTGPFVALAQSRGPLTVLIGFGHAFSVALRRANLVRLCVLAVITVLPSLAQNVLLNTLMQNHVPRPFFWANVPIDVVTIGPLTAIQTAFALDFVRRLEPKPPRVGS